MSCVRVLYFSTHALSRPNFSHLLAGCQLLLSQSYVEIKRQLLEMLPENSHVYKYMKENIFSAE